MEINGWWSNGSKVELVLYFLVAAFSPKAVQKFAEKKMRLSLFPYCVGNHSSEDNL